MQSSTSSSPSCGPSLSADSSGVIPLLDVLADKFSYSDYAYPSRVIWSGETPQFESEISSSILLRWDDISRGLQKDLMFVHEKQSPYFTMLAWAILRDVLCAFSSVPTLFLAVLVKLFGDLSESLSPTDLVSIFGPPEALSTIDRTWFYCLPLWVFRFWAARIGHSPPATCRDALRWLFPSVPFEVTWRTVEIVPPALQSLLIPPVENQPHSLTADILWTRVLALPWSTFSLLIVKDFLRCCQVSHTGAAKHGLLLRCLNCITWGTLHPLVPPGACQTSPVVPVPDCRWSFSKERSHHLISLEELSSASSAYLTELATSLKTLHAVRHETILETWESLSSLEQLDPVYLQSTSMAAVTSPILNVDTRILEDDNLNFLSPFGDDEFLFSSITPDASASTVSLAIRRAITEMSKLPQERRTYMVVRELDATVVGKVLLATFETQQLPVELRTNFYLCTDIQQRPGCLPRLQLTNVTKDHRLSPDSVLITAGGSVMSFSDTALSQAHIACKLLMPVSDLLLDSNSIWIKPGNDAYANHEIMRNTKVVRKPEKNNQLLSFQDLGGYQMLLGSKTSKDVISSFQGNPINIINKIATSANGYCQLHFSDLVKMLSNLQNVDYVQWAPLLLVLARADCALISLTYNHDGPAVAGAMKPVKYSLNTSRNIVEPTLLNIWRHMEAVYDWEPAMFEALASVAARCSHLVNDYSTGSDSKVVPLLISHTLAQVASIFQAANIPHTMYIPPASATSATALPVETVQDIVIALSLIPFVANHGHVAAALSRIQTELYPSTPTSSAHATKSERGQKRSRHESSKDTTATAPAVTSDKRLRGGSKYTPSSTDSKGSPDTRCCHDFFTVEGCGRKDCQYKHMAKIPERARARVTSWAARKGVALRSDL